MSYDETAIHPRKIKTKWPSYVWLILAFMLACVVGVFAIAHTQATSAGQTSNSAKSRVISCTALIEQGVAVKDLPDLCTNKDIRQYYKPESIKPALTRLVLIQLAFDCDQYAKVKISPMPPVCDHIPSLDELTAPDQGKP